MICSNCKKHGHKLKECRSPILSCGTLLFKFENQKIKLLCLEKKDTFAFMSIIRGRYNDKYSEVSVKQFLQEVTEKEKQKLRTSKFIDLWNILFLNKKSKMYIHDYYSAKQKFLRLNIQDIIEKEENIDPQYLDTEIDFPKGRPNCNETYKETAVRETREETQFVNNVDYILLDDISPLETSFLASDGIIYKYKFFIGIIINKNKKLMIDKTNILQYGEIRNLDYIDIDDLDKQFRQYEIYKRKLICSLKEKIQKYFFSSIL
jgi:8-oxo-dGTP pyrophosphatase MutT (NUDIX family)